MGHLMKDSTHFLSFEDFTERFNIKANFLTLQGEKEKQRRKLTKYYHQIPNFH